MASTMVRAINDSSAFIVIRAFQPFEQFEHAIFIQIDTSEQCQLESNCLENLLCRILGKMSTATTRKSPPSNINIF